MQVTRFAAIVLLALPLGGCLGVTLPSQPLPDWAMNSQSQEQFQEQSGVARAKKPRVARQSEPRAMTWAQSELSTGSSSSGSGAQRPTRDLDAKPFAPGWDAREDERDPSLRNTLNICRGC